MRAMDFEDEELRAPLGLISAARFVMGVKNYRLLSAVLFVGRMGIGN